MEDAQYIARVLKNVDAYVAAGLWSRPPKLNPRAWINNFEQDEKAVAAAILDRLSFFSPPSVDYLLLGAIKRWKSRPEGGFPDPSTLVWTRVEGEEPNPTDSGFIFSRKARDVLHVEESSVVEPVAALEHFARGGNVVFLDDFVGSGRQLYETYKRSYGGSSFQEVALTASGKLTMICLIATEQGKLNLANWGVNVHVVATHSLGKSDSIRDFVRRPFEPESVDGSAVDELLAKYAPRLQVKAFLDPLPSRKHGFHELGLTVAFDHCAPDASLPIIWAPGPEDWTRLVVIR